MSNPITPDCYHCIHRREIPCHCHSACNNPKAKVTGNPHAIRMGWFLWPFNFDPTWLESCDGFEAASATTGIKRSIITTHEEELKAMLVALQASADAQLAELRVLRRILIGSLNEEQVGHVARHLVNTGDLPSLSPDEADRRAGFLKTTPTEAQK